MNYTYDPNTDAVVTLHDPAADAYEFRKVFGQPVGVPIQSDTAAMQAVLISEEATEFLQAFDLAKCSAEDLHCSETLKELADTVYVCYQFAAALGWDLDEALDRVHKSNMSKLTEAGEVLRRKDGKILKSERYAPPSLSDLV